MDILYVELVIVCGALSRHSIHGNHAHVCTVVFC